MEFNYLYTDETAQTIPMDGVPGYFYEWVDPIGDWVLKHMPVQGVYSPPIYDSSLAWYHISIPQGVSLGSLKGDGALHFENPVVKLPFQDSAEDWFQHWSGATYVFYREDIHKIEVWSTDLHKSVVRIVAWLDEVQKNAKANKKTLKNWWMKQ